MIHNIKFRAFVYEDEDVDEISQAILNILPEAEIEAEEAEGMLRLDHTLSKNPLLLHKVLQLFDDLDLDI